MSTEKLRALRQEFPVLAEGLCFLDWGATGLLPRRTHEAAKRYLDELATCPGRESTWPHVQHHETREAARAVIARLLGAEAKDVGLLENTTAGLNAAAGSIRMEAGQNVVLSATDYLAVATPWKHRAKRDGIELRFVEPRGAAIEAQDLLDAVDEKTRVIAISTIGWTTGALLDVDRVANEARMRGILLVLDAMQTFGVVPIDAARLGVSFLAVGGHKWLSSTLGAGFLYVNPLIAARHQPPFLGFLSGRPPRGNWGQWFENPSSSPKDEVLFPNSARSFESGGTPSFIGAIGLLEGARVLEEAGADAICAHVRDLGDRMIAGADELGIEVLTPRERSARGGIIVLKAKGGAEEERAWQKRLRERGVVVSVRYSRGLGGVRISLHGMNDAGDVDRLIGELRRILRRESS